MPMPIRNSNLIRENRISRKGISGSYNIILKGQWSKLRIWGLCNTCCNRKLFLERAKGCAYRIVCRNPFRNGH